MKPIVKKILNSIPVDEKTGMLDISLYDLSKKIESGMVEFLQGEMAVGVADGGSDIGVRPLVVG